MPGDITADQLDQVLSGGTQQQAPQQTAPAPQVAQAQPSGPVTSDDLDQALSQPQPAAQQPQQAGVPTVPNHSVDPFAQVHKYQAPSSMPAAHVARYAKPDILSPISGHMDLAPDENDHEYRPVNSPQDLWHNQVQAVKHGFRGMEAIAPGILREANNFMAQPPAGMDELHKSEFKMKKAQAIAQDLKAGGQMALNSLPPLYLAEKYGRPLAHAFLGQTVGETPEEQHLALKKFQHEFEVNPLGVVLDMAPGWGMASDLGKQTAKLTGKAVKSSAGVAAKVIPRHISEHVSARVSKLRDMFPQMFSPAALSQLLKEVEASKHTADMRRMRQAIMQAYHDIPREIRNVLPIVLERTDPKYAEFLNHPTVQKFAHLTDQYWAPLWEEMKQRGWMGEAEELAARWFPEWASKVHRGEIEAPHGIDPEHMSTILMQEPEVEAAVRKFAHEQIQLLGQAAEVGRYVPIVFYGTLRKHFSGTMGHVMQSVDSMSMDEIHALDSVVKSKRTKARPQTQRVGKDTAVGMREKGQSMNAAESHIYKLEAAANVLAFARQAQKITDEILKLHPDKQAAAATKLMKKLAPYLAEAGVTPAEIHELQELSKIIYKTGQEIKGNSKNILHMQLLGDSWLKDMNKKINQVVRHVYVAMNALYPIKITASSVVFFMLGTDFNPRSIFHALIGLRLMAPMKIKGKWQKSPLAAKISKDFQLPTIEAHSNNPVLRVWQQYTGLAHEGSNYLMRSWVTAKLLDEMSQMPAAMRRTWAQNLRHTFDLTAQIQDFGKGMRALHGGYVKEELYNAAHIGQELHTQSIKRYGANLVIKRNRQLISELEKKLEGARALPSLLTKPDMAEIDRLQKLVDQPRGIALHDRIRYQKELVAQRASLDKIEEVEAQIEKLQGQIEKAQAKIEKAQRTIAESKGVKNALVGGLTKRFSATPQNYLLSDKKLPSGYRSNRRLTHYVDTIHMGQLGKKIEDWNKLYDKWQRHTHMLFGDYGRALPPLLDDLRGLDLWLFMHKHFFEATAYLWMHNPQKMVALQALAQQTDKAHDQHVKDRNLPDWVRDAGAWMVNTPTEDGRMMLQFSGGWNGLAEVYRVAAALAEIVNPEELPPGEREARETRDVVSQLSPLADMVWTWNDPDRRGVYNNYIINIGADSHGRGGKNYNILALAQRVKKLGWAKANIDARNDAVSSSWMKPQSPFTDVHRALTALKKAVPDAGVAVEWAQSFAGKEGDFEKSPMTIPGVPGMEFPKWDLDKGEIRHRPYQPGAMVPGLSAIAPVSVKTKSDKAELAEAMAHMPPNMKPKQQSDQLKLLRKVAQAVQLINNEEKTGRAHLLPRSE